MINPDPKATSWLADASFNLLVDYYPEVQCRPYGTGATRENVVPFLKELELGYLCIYTKGHSGYTTWNSSLQTQHTQLGQDMPKAFRAYTRETNTRLVLYFSGLLDGLAGIRHPDWCMQNPDGSTKEFFQMFPNMKVFALCPLSPFFDEWVSIQLRELIGNYDPEGIWVDGDWPGPCYCPRCQARFKSDTGWEGDWAELQKRPDFQATYQRTWARIEHEWRTRFRNFVKSLKADCVYSAGNVSPRREFAAPFDWRSGDFFSPQWFHLHDMARMMRWYGTLDTPYDAYVCDTSFTHPRVHVRSRTKTLDRMLQEAVTVAAAGGAVGYWTYPMGNGAWIPSRMKKAIAVRKFIKERESQLMHSTSAHWTAILVSDPATPTFGGGGVEGAHKAMAALHRSPDIMDETGIKDGSAGTPRPTKMEELPQGRAKPPAEPLLLQQPTLPYDLIVVPEQAVLDQQTAQHLEAFVRAGGKLLTNGSTIISPELKKMLGVTGVSYGHWHDGHVRLKTHDEPTGVSSGWDRLELDAGTEELYPLYRSWDQDNPGLNGLTNNWPMHGLLDEENPELAGAPAAILRKVGKGCIVHICTDIFNQYRALGDPQMLRWLREIMTILQPDPLCDTDAPSWVDLSLRRDAEGQLLVHFVNQNPGRDVVKLGSDDIWVDEIPEVGPYKLMLRLAKKPADVQWAPEGRVLKSFWEKGVLTIEVPRFKIHGCVVVRE